MTRRLFPKQAAASRELGRPGVQTKRSRKPVRLKCSLHVIQAYVNKQQELKLEPQEVGEEDSDRSAERDSKNSGEDEEEDEKDDSIEDDMKTPEKYLLQNSILNQDGAGDHLTSRKSTGSLWMRYQGNTRPDTSLESQYAIGYLVAASRNIAADIGALDGSLIACNPFTDPAIALQGL
ncbi:hypothetical protein V5799_005513 [Amblyomma americanum]|uniref:Uncharacterized protein n=1 Tax=Amblyomma americanum TaxID=6943 RepID=A0AAQ4DZ14_AMBAM